MYDKNVTGKTISIIIIVRITMKFAHSTFKTLAQHIA